MWKGCNERILGRSVTRSVGQSVERSDGQSVGRSYVFMSIWQTDRQSVSRSFSVCLNRSLGRFISFLTDWLTDQQTDCFIPRIQSFKGLEWRENFSETFKVWLKVNEKGPLFWFSLIGLYIPTFHHIYEVGKFLLFYTWTGGLESKVKRLKPLENFPELGQSDKRTDRR